MKIHCKFVFGLPWNEELFPSHDSVNILDGTMARHVAGHNRKWKVEYRRDKTFVHHSYLHFAGFVDFSKLLVHLYLQI